MSDLATPLSAPPAARARAPLPAVLTGAEADAVLDAAVAGLVAGKAVPFLGPGLLAMSGDAVPVPTTPEAVAAALNGFTAAPGRIRTNMWSVAQYIEQRRHRRTLIANMAEIFAPMVAPSPLHLALARLEHLSMIVDTWYDGAMRDALSIRDDWAEIQGVTRALETFDVWWRPYGPEGQEIAPSELEAARLLVYKPHGAVIPSKNFLVADSDYVEVLTEIDIQSPIPEAVKDRRATRGFVFLGCRFHDQMLRTYARQIIKRSKGPHVVVVDRPEDLTRNELKFFADQLIVPVAATLPAFTTRLQAAAA